MLALSAFLLIMMFPDMVSHAIQSMSSTAEQRHRITSTDALEDDEPSPDDPGVGHNQFFAVASAFLFQAYYAGKVLVLLVSWPTFRSQLIALVRCRFGLLTTSWS